MGLLDPIKIILDIAIIGTIICIACWPIVNLIFGTMSTLATNPTTNVSASVEPIYFNLTTAFRAVAIICICSGIARFIIYVMGGDQYQQEGGMQ